MNRIRRALVAGALLIAAAAPAGERDKTLGLFGDRHPEVLYSVETDEPVIALTIDDAPDANTTPALLEVLAEHDAHATFFLISERVAGNEDLVRSILAAGHEIGNHMTQDEPSVELPPEVFERKLLDAHAVLSQFRAPRWFRPGSGWYDDIMLDILRRHGYQCVLGTIYPLDAHIGWVWLAKQMILAMAAPGRIIILHDGSKRGQRTARTLREVLPVLNEQGYRVVSVSELASAARSAPPVSRVPDPAAGFLYRRGQRHQGNAGGEEIDAHQHADRP